MSPLARLQWLASLIQTDAPSAVPRVAIVFAYRMNAKTAQLNPGIDTITAESGRTERTVYRALDWLESCGWIIRERGRGRGHRSNYRLVIPGKVTAVAPLPAVKGADNDTIMVTAGIRFPGPKGGATVTEKVTLRSNAYKEGTEKGTGKREARKRATPTPESFAIVEELRSWAQSNDLCDVDLKAETEKFLDHHRSKGSSFKDWTAAWRNWIRRAEEWGRSNRGNGPARVKVPPAWATDDLVTVGRQHGVEARQGESNESFRERIDAAANGGAVH